MHIIIGLLGIGQLGFGILMWIASRSAMHETTAATLIGMGTLALGLAFVIRSAEDILAEIKANGRRMNAANNPPQPQLGPQPIPPKPQVHREHKWPD